ALASVLLAGAADPDGVRAFSRMDSAVPELARQPREGNRAAVHSARAGRFSQLGAGDAADALVDARGAAAGLHPHGARERRLRHLGALLSRPAQCRAAPWS